MKRVLDYKQHWLWLLAGGITLVLSAPRIFTALSESGRILRRGMDDSPEEALRFTLISFFAFLALGYLNAFLPGQLRPNWKQVVLRFIANILAVFLLVFITVRLQQWMDPEPFLVRPRRTGASVRYFLGALLTVAVLYARIYFLSAREMAVENARIRELHARAELSALQQQLDPHFLFNSLNTVSATLRSVGVDEGLALIEELADVYRYVLNIKDRDRIPLGEELDFITAYGRLLQARFGENFNLSIAVAPDLREATVPPLSLQLLVENAVKHNAISGGQPLTVSVSASGKALEVSNRLQPRFGATTSGGRGLLNLRQRYELLGVAGFAVHERDGKFSVILPLLS